MRLNTWSLGALEVFDGQGSAPTASLLSAPRCHLVVRESTRGVVLLAKMLRDHPGVCVLHMG